MPLEKPFCNTQIINEVAAELGLTPRMVQVIVDCQSEYTKIVMESNSFDHIRLPFLGVFKAKHKELQMLQYLAGMTYEQAEQFKRDVRTGVIRINTWEDKIKAKRKKKQDATN